MADSPLADDQASPPPPAAAEDRDPRRPAFLDELPDCPELLPIVSAFVEGNYAKVRLLARSLDTASVTAEVRAAAEELVRRTQPDRLVIFLFALAFALFFFIAAWSLLGHGH